MATPTPIDAAPAVASAVALVAVPGASDYGLIFIAALVASLVAVSKADGAYLNNRKGLNIIGAGLILALPLSWIGAVMLSSYLKSKGYEGIPETQCMLPVAVFFGYFGHKLLGLAERRVDKKIVEAGGDPNA